MEQPGSFSIGRDAIATQLSAGIRHSDQLTSGGVTSVVTMTITTMVKYTGGAMTGSPLLTVPRTDSDHPRDWLQSGQALQRISTHWL